MSPFGVCFILLFVVGSSAWQSPGQFPTCSDAEHIVALLSQNHDSSVRVGNVETAASFYDPEVIVMPNGHPTFVGKDVWKATMVWIHNVGSIKVTLDEVACLGSSRLVIVRKTSKITAKSGVVMFDGKTIQIWRRTDMGYHIYLEMYNNNA